MGRKKEFLYEDIPPQLELIVRSICSDYTRRKQALISEQRAREVLDNYKRINSAIDKAIQIVEVAIRPIMLKDISERIGYDFSDAREMMCKETYYNRKRQIILMIAQNLKYI